jgi:hypothetical protein
MVMTQVGFKLLKAVDLKAGGLISLEEIWFIVLPEEER